MAYETIRYDDEHPQRPSDWKTRRDYKVVARGTGGKILGRRSGLSFEQAKALTLRLPEQYPGTDEGEVFVGGEPVGRWFDIYL